jgi:hypothetical protein
VRELASSAPPPVGRKGRGGAKGGKGPKAKSAALDAPTPDEGAAQPRDQQPARNVDASPATFDIFNF